MNSNTRVEAFCDGVFAIAITLLVIDIKIPITATIHDTHDLWQALLHITPSIFTFLLSFIVILITWVNHHNFLKDVHKTCSSFLYANGFLLLTVVFFPFPTSLLGEYVLTDHAAPAVILYDLTLALQAVGWRLVSQSAMNNHLEKSPASRKTIAKSGQYSGYAFFLYSLCTVFASLFPLAIAIFTTLTWLFWLVHSINNKPETTI